MVRRDKQINISYIVLVFLDDMIPRFVVGVAAEEYTERLRAVQENIRAIVEILAFIRLTNQRFRRSKDLQTVPAVGPILTTIPILPAASSK